MSRVVITVNCLPPSGNERDPKKRAAARESFEKAIMRRVRTKLPPKGSYALRGEFFGKFRAKGGKGDWLKRDHQNFTKFATDVACKALGIDDSRIVVWGPWTKEHSSGDKTVLTFWSV